jgi:hypothetical protein
VTSLPTREGGDAEQRVLIGFASKAVVERLITRKQGPKLLRDRGPLQRREGYVMRAIQSVAPERFLFTFARGKGPMVVEQGADGRRTWAPYNLWQHVETLDTRRRLVLQMHTAEDVAAMAEHALKEGGSQVPADVQLPPKPAANRGRGREPTGETPINNKRTSRFPGASGGNAA